MKTDAEVRLQGMQALADTFGLTAAERFLAPSLRDRFDSTEWRRHGLPHLQVAQLDRCAPEQQCMAR